MRISKFDESYLEQVLEMEKDVFSDAWSKEMFLSEIDIKNGIFYLCLEGEKLVGYIIARKILDEIEILNIAVDSQYRRQKIGEKLLLEILNMSDVSLFSLEVRTSNEPAIALYKKHGFKPVFIRKRYYENPSEDALVMIKENKA